MTSVKIHGNEKLAFQQLCGKSLLCQSRLTKRWLHMKQMAWTGPAFKKFLQMVAHARETALAHYVLQMLRLGAKLSTWQMNQNGRWFFLHCTIQRLIGRTISRRTWAQFQKGTPRLVLRLLVCLFASPVFAVSWGSAGKDFTKWFLANQTCGRGNAVANLHSALSKQNWMSFSGTSTSLQRSLLLLAFMLQTHLWFLGWLFFVGTIMPVSGQVLPEEHAGLEEEAATTQKLMDWCQPSSPVEFVIQNCGGRTHALRRYLPHGTPTDLYWQYLAWHETRLADGYETQVLGSKVFGCRLNGERSDGSKAASWSTFWRVYQRWQDILRPRAKSDHAQCQTCFDLQTELYAKHISPQKKLDLAHAWRTHLQQQYLDRQIYWNLRHCSRQPGSDILTIIIDSMDKKKTVWPKWTFDRPSKEIEKLGARPRVIVTAAMAHGHAILFFLQPEELTHGADGYCETLCQTIEHVSQALGPQPLPRHLVLQVDNTVSQAKNGFVGAFCAYVVAKQMFQTVTMNYLMVGHTHEDIDQVFSLLVSQVVRRYRYETVQDLKQYMEAVLGPAFQAKGEAFKAIELNSVRKFTDWLAPLGVVQHGCWQSRHGIEAPHSFCYKLYMDLTGEEKSKCSHHRWFGAAMDKDVMCCVKTYMRDTHLQQLPLCVLPADRLDRVHTLSPERSVGPCMTLPEMERFKVIANVLDDRRYGYHKAAASLRLLVERSSVTGPLVPELDMATPWLSKVNPDRAPLVYPDTNPFFSHLPDSSWHMKVQIRRT